MSLASPETRPGGGTAALLAGSGAAAVLSPGGALSESWTTRQTNWTFESAGSSTRRGRSPRPTASLRTDDIVGAKTGTSPSYRALRFMHNRPPGFGTSDIAGASPRRFIPQEVHKRNDFNISNKDIDHSSPESKSFRTKRVLDPLNPVYTLSSYTDRPATPPRQVAETCKISDIPGTAARPIHRRPQRNHIDYSDVPGSSAQVGAAWDARKRKTAGLSLVATDINYPPDVIPSRFVTKRCTNPMSPRYVLHAPPGVSPEEFAERAAELPGSHPRQQRWHKPEADCSFSLRSTDIDGASARDPVPFPQKRRQWRDTCNIGDIPAARPTGRFHKMHGEGNRCTDPCNPRYPALDRPAIRLPEAAPDPGAD